MSDFRARLDRDERCGVCGLPRHRHWGRRNGLAPQKLGHQWRPSGETGRKVERTAPGVCGVCGGQREHDLDTHIRAAALIERED